MSSLWITGLAIGGVALSERLQIAPLAPPAPTSPGNVGTEHASFAWFAVRSRARDLGYRGADLADMFSTMIASALSTYGVVPGSGSGVPRWPVADAVKELDRWATLGELFQEISRGPTGGGRYDDAAAIQSELDEVRHWRNFYDRDWGDPAFVSDPTCKQAYTSIRRLVVAMDAAGDYWSTDPDFDASFGHFLGESLHDRIDDLGSAAGWVGGKIGGLAGSLGLGIVKGLVSSPAGAAVLLVGGYLIVRRLS